MSRGLALAAPAALAALLAPAACTGGRTGLGHGALEGGAADSGPAVFACGDAGCEVATEYCKRVVGGPPPGVHNETCTPLPGGCRACDCVSLARECKCAESGGVSVTCSVP